MASGMSGGSKLTQKLREMVGRLDEASSVSVGFLEGTTEQDGTSLPMIAAIQEFGAPAKGIPPRPFMRPTVTKGSPQWGAKLEKVLQVEGYDAKAALTFMGGEIQAEMQDSIRDVAAPALSPVTLLLRQRFGNNPQEITFKDVQKARRDIASGKVPNVTTTQAHPLIWTGTMLNSVDYEVK